MRSRTSLGPLARAALTAVAIAAAASGADAATAQRPEVIFGPKAKSGRPAAAKPARKKAVTAKPANAASSASASSGPANAPSASRSSSGFAARHAAALDMILSGQSSTGIRALRELSEDASASAADRDRARVSLGRALYGKGDYEGAIEAYKRVGRGSDAWFLALEERGWASLKLDRPDDALGPLKTLMMPIFSERVGPEPYFLAALTHLRVCDYASVFKTIETFKQRFRPRVAEWESAQSSDPDAKAKLAEVSETVQKLSLVEAEAIQRVYMPDEIKGHVGPERKITRARDEISFPRGPRDEQEVWLDEVDKVQVSVKGCPKAGAVSSGVAGGSVGKGGRAL